MILEQIYIGSYADACDARFQRERGITHILCCADELPMPQIHAIYNKGKGAWHHIPIVDDKRDETTPAKLLEAANVIDSWVNAGNKIIVHCYAGMSRSVSAVIAYFILKKGWTYDMAFSLIKLRRPIANPHDCYVPILKSFMATPWHKEAHLTLPESVRSSDAPRPHTETDTSEETSDLKQTV